MQARHARSRKSTHACEEVDHVCKGAQMALQEGTYACGLAGTLVEGGACIWMEELALGWRGRARRYGACMEMGKACTAISGRAGIHRRRTECEGIKI